MRMLKAQFLFVLFMLGGSALRAAEQKGPFAGVGLGQTTATLTNPDSSLATYTGPSFFLRAGYTTMLGDDLKGTANVSCLYRDLTNTGNNAAQKEYANYMGPGAGVSFGYGFFFLGADYWMLTAKHRSVGSLSRELDFRLNPLTYYAGVSMEFNAWTLELGYTQGTATASKSQTGVSADSAYSESSVWVHLKLLPGRKTFGGAK